MTQTQPLRMNLYEKILVPLAVLGIGASVGIGAQAISTAKENSVILERVVKQLDELEKKTASNETDIAVLKDRDERG